MKLLFNREYEALIDELDNYKNRYEISRNNSNLYQDEIKRLNNIINEAIKFIDKNYNEEDAVGYLVSKDHIEKILKILKGGKENESE